LSEDEDDLEMLRLAALRTIKKRDADLNGSMQYQHRGLEKGIRFNRLGKAPLNKRGRFFGPHQGRSGKNGQFIRSRNPNLIPIPTTASDDEAVKEKTAGDGGITLTLPQDRYCSTISKEEKKEEETSKFNRYNKSDESETESEEEEEAVSEDTSPGKLHKADSLEALMQELDDEIQGKTKSPAAKTEKPKMKKIKKKKHNASERVSTSDSDAKPGEATVTDTECTVNVEVIRHIEGDNENEVKNPVVEVKPAVENQARFDGSYSPSRKRPRSRSPLNRRGFQNRRRLRNFHQFQNPPPPPPQNVPYVANIVPPYQVPLLPFANPPFNPMFAPPNVMNQPPPFFERPLSPLGINAESLTAVTMAPLSPRSAAFVLENKAIIERRKRSPRRSYSRSRSSSRSLTPRRSPRRSLSPLRRLSRSPRRLSRSPRRRSPSPRRRSLSPRRRNIGKSAEDSPKNRAPIRDRLGAKSKNEESNDKAKETPPEPKKEEKLLDPILEARKRKFESNEIKKREGIIRLKPKESENGEVPTPVPAPEVPAPEKINIVEEKPAEVKKVEEKPEEPDVVEELENLLREDALMEGDDIDLTPKVGDIFSDEDSASDNEGRFKIKEGNSSKPPVLSFTKLINGEKKEIKTEALPDSSTKRNERRRDRRRTDRRRTRTPPLNRKEVPKENVKSRKSPASKKSESAEKPQSTSRSRVALKSERHVAPIERRFERKIEIKIKNPSKYERGSSKSKYGKEEETKRKVELNKEVEEDKEEPEIVVENTSGDEENSAISEGDLRAQLSKKRAEKLHRIPIEGVSSRLLQNALQGAVFRKTKKKLKEQDITSTDGKLPIHLRLGIANNSDIFSEPAPTATKAKRKSRKRKNREVLEQV
ncbi:hypothetical protein NQ315_000359, partial [Exocentrus adspersus]